MNPIKILIDDFNIPATYILRAIRIEQITHDTLRGWYKRSHLPAMVKKRLTPLALQTWGDNNPSPEAKRLWQCYFPDSKPHIYHYLHYTMDIPIATLADWADCRTSTIHRILRQDRLHRRQLQAIGKPAMEYIEALRSPKAGGGTDERYQILYRALHDKDRIK